MTSDCAVSSNSSYARVDSPNSLLDRAMGSFAAGDDDAFTRVYRLAAPPLFRMLVRLAKDAVLAEDLVQETLVRMYRARASYEIGAPVLPWAFTIARRLHIDLIRERRRDVDALPALEIAMSPRASSADDLLHAKRMAIVVEEVLAELPPAQAQAFRILHDGALTLDQAAARLGTTNMSLRLRRHRATKAIRAELRAG